jgi:hypothetical protein
METIDVTPTWTEILNTLLVLHEQGDSKGRQTARSELTRMAQLADAYIEVTKKRMRGADQS